MMLTHEKAVSDCASDHGLENDSRQEHSTPRRSRRVVDAQSQRARLLAYLVARKSISTLEARGHPLRIMSPAARIFDLRAEGVSILTTHDARQGCGRYVLVSGGEHGDQ